MQDTARELNVARVSRLNNFNNNSNFNAEDRNVDNNNICLRGIAQMKAETFFRDLWKELCSFDNLYLAFKKAKKHKTTKDYVIEFERELSNNLLAIRSELLLHSYSPKPLVNFIIRDPKTRKISKSNFRDRVVHHALCNIIEPIFERIFIYDSYANRVGKGTINAIKRFDYFKRKVSRNNNAKCYALKADIKKYFESVNHGILISIIKKKIKDNNILWLINKILSNCTYGGGGRTNAGMPLGNLTSQFFANVYLNELDYFIKHRLKVRYYIRYVDDFVILHNSKEQLEKYKCEISHFLIKQLSLQLHPDKSKIFQLSRGTTFLGLRIFQNHKLLKKSNIRKFEKKLEQLCIQFDEKQIDYDIIYDFLEGWLAYSKQANSCNLRRKLFRNAKEKFANEISTKEFNRYARIS